MKHNWKPGTMIYPLPAVLVSCGATPEEYNLFTVAWTGTVCTNPPMCYISVRPKRYSYPIIRRQGEFVINLTTEDLAFATDWCGVRSGRDYRKFEEMKLTPGKAGVVNVQADDRYLNPETGKFELDRANPLVYTHGEYFGLGKKIGKFGWSVEKKKKKNKK